MFVLARTLVYATLFIGLVFIYLPARILAWSGIAGPASFGARQLMGSIVAAVGAAIVVWCIGTFTAIGRGTPAPFDPPRRLVVRGPYRYVRNPMYIGAGLVLAGTALYYGSLALVGYAMAFLVVIHVFVVAHEEPALRAAFGTDYADYCRRVGRWWPAPHTAARAVKP